MNELLTKLNETQRKVVLHFKGPLIVSAVAGAGKTTSIVHRIAYLIKYRGVDPRRILATTFTRKAARHMNDRIAALGVSNVRVGTLHSVAYEILRTDGRTPKYQGAYRIKDDLRVSPEFVKNWGLENRADINALRRVVGWCKNMLLSPEEAIKQPPQIKRLRDSFGRDKLERYLNAYARWEAFRRRRKVLTYDDILYQCWFLLQDNPDVLNRWRSRYHFLIIDEVQDTCLAQHEIMRLLAEPRNNLCVVGDVDQSIYSFRAAMPELMVQLAQKYPQAVVKMENNYRSVPLICTSANKLIAYNSMRLPTAMKATRPSSSLGAPLQYRTFGSDDDEQRFVAECLCSHNRHYAWSDMAVLCRTNSKCRSFEQQLIKFRIPYRRVGASFLELAMIRVLLDYLRVGRDAFLNRKTWDLDSLEATINVPARSLGEVYFSRLQTRIDSGTPMGEAITEAATNATQAKKAGDYVKLVGEIADMIKRRCPPSWIMDRIADDLHLPEHFGRHDERKVKAYGKMVDDLVAFSKEYKTTKRFLRFIDEIMISDDEPPDSSDLRGKDDNKVLLSTIHRVKGLEFNVVILTGCSEGILPHMRSVILGAETKDPSYLEEERRLAYVAITRAKNHAWLTSATGGSSPSTFLREMSLIT